MSLPNHHLVSTVDQSNPKLDSEEQRNAKVNAQEEIVLGMGCFPNIAETNLCTPCIRQHKVSASTLQTEQETKNDGNLGLRSRCASIPTIGTTQNSIAGTCTLYTKTLDLNSVKLPIRIDPPSTTSDRTLDRPATLPSGGLASEHVSTTHPNPVCAAGDDDYEERSSELIDTTTAKEPVIAAEILTDNGRDLESREDRDLSTVIVKSKDKGKGVDPREYGGATCNLISNIIPTETNSARGSDVIELVHRVRPDKGKNVDPRERGNRAAEYRPGASRIDFHDYTSYDWELASIPMYPLQPLEPDVTSHGPPHDPTLSRARWHPKISPYRLIMLLTPVTFGTAKAIISQNGGVTVPITIEWVTGVVVSSMFFLLGSYETRTGVPKYLSWLFKPDCVDVVWYLAGRLSIRRPEYLSTELDLEIDPGHLVTSYRILVSAAVFFFGSLKATYTFTNLSTGSIWVEWFAAGFGTSLLYYGGLYENNSLRRWSSFFRKDRSDIIHMNFIGPRKGATSVPNIIGLSFLFVVYSSLLLPFVKETPPIGIPEDFQLSIGPSLSKSTLEDIFMVVTCYIPSISIFVFVLSFLIEQLPWAPILASTTTLLPSGIRYHAGQFFRKVERVAQRHPMERLVHHSVSLLQLILLVTENLWTIFFLLFFDVLVAELGDDKYALSFKIVFHMFMALTLIPSWFFVATGAPGVIRWQPTGDHLARFIPPSIANATVTKLIQRKVKALRRLSSFGPSDPTKYHRVILIIQSILIFSSCYGTFIIREAELPATRERVSILMVLMVGLWLYLYFKFIPDIIRAVLWNMTPTLHYSFQDLKESICDSIEIL